MLPDLLDGLLVGGQHPGRDVCGAAALSDPSVVLHTCLQRDVRADRVPDRCGAAHGGEHQQHHHTPPPRHPPPGLPRPHSPSPSPCRRACSWRRRSASAAVRRSNSWKRARAASRVLLLAPPPPGKIGLDLSGGGPAGRRTAPPLPPRCGGDAGGVPGRALAGAGAGAGDTGALGRGDAGLVRPVEVEGTVGRGAGAGLDGKRRLTKGPIPPLSSECSRTTWDTCRPVSAQARPSSRTVLPHTRACWRASSE